MKTLFTYLLILCSLSTAAQGSLVQVNGWNAYVHLPDTYNDGSNRKYPAILFIPGTGEVGTNAAKLLYYGPSRYLMDGWNGKTGNIEWIVISLQPASLWPTEFSINTRLATLKISYRIDPANIFMTGYSMGGWCDMTFVTGDLYGGPYTYASQINGIVSVQGVVAEDNQPWPDLFDNFAQVGGSMLNFEQVFDQRGGDQACARMNATRPGSATYILTNFSNGAHCCPQQYYGGQLFNINGTMQSMYGWMASKVRSVVALPQPVPVPTNDLPFFHYDRYEITLNSDHKNVYTIVNMLGQVVMKGSYGYGITTISMNQLKPGVYAMFTYKGTFKIVKL